MALGNLFSGVGVGVGFPGKQQAMPAARQAYLQQNVSNQMYEQYLAQQAFDNDVRSADNPVNMQHRARELFMWRMGGVRREFKLAHGNFVQTHVENDMVHLFYCFGGKTGVVSERIDEFPTDQLIAQFRMILA